MNQIQQPQKETEVYGQVKIIVTKDKIILLHSSNRKIYEGKIISETEQIVNLSLKEKDITQVSTSNGQSSISPPPPSSSSSLHPSNTTPIPDPTSTAEDNTSKHTKSTSLKTRSVASIQIIRELSYDKNDESNKLSLESSGETFRIKNTSSSKPNRIKSSPISDTKSQNSHTSIHVNSSENKTINTRSSLNHTQSNQISDSKHQKEGKNDPFKTLNNKDSESKPVFTRKSPRLQEKLSLAKIAIDIDDIDTNNDMDTNNDDSSSSSNNSDVDINQKESFKESRRLNSTEKQSFQSPYKRLRKNSDISINNTVNSLNGNGNRSSNTSVLPTKLVLTDDNDCWDEDDVKTPTSTKFIQRSSNSSSKHLNVEEKYREDDDSEEDDSREGSSKNQNKSEKRTNKRSSRLSDTFLTSPHEEKITKAELRRIHIVRKLSGANMDSCVEEYGHIYDFDLLRELIHSKCAKPVYRPLTSFNSSSNRNTIIPSDKPSTIAPVSTEQTNDKEYGRNHPHIHMDLVLDSRKIKWSYDELSYLVCVFLYLRKINCGTAQKDTLYLIENDPVARDIFHPNHLSNSERIQNGLKIVRELLGESRRENTQDMSIRDNRTIIEIIDDDDDDDDDFHSPQKRSFKSSGSPISKNNSNNRN